MSLAPHIGRTALLRQTRRATTFLVLLLTAVLCSRTGLAAPGAAAPAPAPSAPPPCIENPDGVEGDDGDVGGCRNCTTDGSNRCAVCWDFYTLTQEGTCARCNATSKPQGPAAIICMACESTNASRCTNCNGDLSGELEYGFYPDADGVCVQCPVDKCMRCDGEPLGTCTRCAQGWGLVGGQCKQCKDKEKCRRCDGDAAKCRECQWGYFPDPEGRCAACPANCGNCTSTTACLECTGAYALDPATKLCVACAEGCAGCSDGVDTCDGCDSGYTANTTDGSLCQKCADPRCAICEAGPTSCTICDDPDMKYGPDLQQGDCKLCAIEHCANCQEDYTACRWCVDGYWWNVKEGKCTPCQGEHCRACATNGDTGLEECSSCQDGYGFDDPNSSQPKCVKAQS